MDRAGQHLNLSLPAAGEEISPPPRWTTWPGWPKSRNPVANSRRSLSDYIAVIRGEGLRRSGQSEDALLLAAQKKNLEKKAYMEEKP